MRFVNESVESAEEEDAREAEVNVVSQVVEFAASVDEVEAERPVDEVEAKRSVDEVEAKRSVDEVEAKRSVDEVDEETAHREA